MHDFELLRKNKSMHVKAEQPTKEELDQAEAFSLLMSAKLNDRLMQPWIVDENDNPRMLKPATPRLTTTTA